MAIGVIEAASEMRLHIPGDLSVVGFDDTILSRIITPRMTTISQPIQEMGKKVFDMLLDKDFQNQKILFLPELVVRNSTGEIRNR